MVAAVLIVVGALITGGVHAHAAPLATYVVTNTSNSGPGSLRDALDRANTDGIATTIVFNIPTTDPGFNGRWFTIRVLPLKPGGSGNFDAQTEGATTIDGTTQMSFTGDTNPLGPEIDLDFSATVGGIRPALSLWSDENVVRGVTVRGTPNVGVALWGSRNLLEDSYVGTDPTGQVASPNTVGVSVRTRSCAFACVPGETGPFPPATDNVIRRNVISGNGGDGISIEDATRTVVKGDLIGTDASGARALPNATTPTAELAFPVGLRVGRGSLIGGTDPGARNVISGNAGRGVWIGRGVHESVIQGNLIGTDITGSAAIPNEGGGIVFKISCTGDPDCEPTDNVIGGGVAGAGNVISGNQGNGIHLAGIRSRVEGNLIGTDVTGTRALPNAGDGIGFGVQGGGSDHVIRGNLVSGNSRNGISLNGPRHVVEGNFIGTNATGTAALPNGGTGLSLEIGSADTRIGGISAGAQNVISGNGGGGIALRPGSARGLIQGNYIGTDVTGSIAIPNAVGIAGKVTGDCPASCPMDHVIGGSTPGAGNVISGNTGNGIHLQGRNYLVEGNRIGTDAAGSAAIPNGEDGIVVGPHGGADGRILHNTVAHNFGAGVNVPTCCPTQYSGPVTVTDNAIFDNGELGIDLGVHGVTPNDPGDADTGPNGLQNFPILYMAIPAGSNVLVRGFVDSPDPSTIDVELFGNDAADPSGYGEGQRYVGTVQPRSNGCFTVLIDAAAVGSHLTATATDGAGNTSEFSAAISIGPGHPAEPPRCASGR